MVRIRGNAGFRWTPLAGGSEQTLELDAPLRDIAPALYQERYSRRSLDSTAIDVTYVGDAVDQIDATIRFQSSPFTVLRMLNEAANGATLNYYRNLDSPTSYPLRLIAQGNLLQFDPDPSMAVFAKYAIRCRFARIDGGVLDDLTGPLGNLAAAVDSWLSEESGERVPYVGVQSSEWAANLNLSGGSDAAGRTFISGIVTERCRQDGYVRRVRLHVAQLGVDNTVIFKVFRDNGDGTYDCVAESEEVTVGATGTRTFDLTQPMACEIGDILGVWLPGATDSGDRLLLNATTAASTTAGILYDAGDLNGEGESFGSSIDNYSLNIDGRGIPPFLIGTGDSIMEGHNAGPMGDAARHHSHYHEGPGGTDSSEILHQIRSREPTLEYQNFGFGGQTWAWVASTGAPDAVFDGTVFQPPRVLVIHCGINDIIAGRTWAQVEANLDTVRGIVPADVALFIDEILPSTALSDANAAVVRTWNANLAVWCATNNATLIECHDAMGEVRASTGLIDDLAAGYDFDGTHLTTEGVDALAAVIHAALAAANW